VLGRARIGADYHKHRRQTMLARNLGLTKTYNLVHRPGCTDADIDRQRALHAEMDRAILACYGWQDLDPGHGFHQNERGQTRFTVSLTPVARSCAGCSTSISASPPRRQPRPPPSQPRGLAEDADPSRRSKGVREPHDEFRSLLSQLGFEREAIAWRQHGNAMEAAIRIAGAPDGAEAELVIRASGEPWPSGSISLLWRGERLHALDLSGPRHRDPRRGSVPTPHCRWIDNLGEAHTDPVDLEREEIRNLESAVRWLVARAGLTWTPTWADAPPFGGARAGRRRGGER
jgi:hypothetical protein